MATNNIGTITQITGAVVDVRFDADLPHILNALHVKADGRLIVLRTRNPELPYIDRPMC